MSNTTDTTKRYRLRKDINMPYKNIKAGTIGVELIPGGYVSFGEDKNSLAYSISDIKKSPDWFEEVLPVSEPVKEKIEVDCFHYDNMNDYYWLRLKRKEPNIPPDKFPEIKNLLERYLNGEMDNPAPRVLNGDTVVEDKKPTPKDGLVGITMIGNVTDYKNSATIDFRDGKPYAIAISGYVFYPTLNTQPEKTYTQSEVDTIRREAFMEARKLETGSVITGYMGNGLKYKLFSDYLSSLNSKEEVKYTSGNPISRDTWKETEQPTNDNAFVWTDEMVLLLCDFCHHNGYHKFDKRVVDEFDEFKSIPCHKRMIPDWIKKHIASKQSAPVDKDENDKGNYRPKPPLGLIPMQIWREHRLQDINDAIERYMDANKEIPQEWINEKQTLQSWLQPEPSALPTKKAQYVPSLKDYVTMNGIVANVEAVFHYKRTCGVVYFNGKETVRDEWHFDAIEPLKNAPTPTEPVVKDKEVLFTTEDGVEIKESDDIVLHHVSPNFDLSWSGSRYLAKQDRGGFKIFSTKVAAEQYIDLNKKQFSKNDIINLLK